VALLVGKQVLLALRKHMLLALRSVSLLRLPYSKLFGTYSGIDTKDHIWEASGQHSDKGELGHRVAGSLAYQYLLQRLKDIGPRLAFKGFASTLDFGSGSPYGKVATLYPHPYNTY
jgi:hypothetical protein